MRFAGWGFGRREGRGRGRALVPAVRASHAGRPCSPPAALAPVQLACGPGRASRSLGAQPSVSFWRLGGLFISAARPGEGALSPCGVSPVLEALSPEQPWSLALGWGLALPSGHALRAPLLGAPGRCWKTGLGQGLEDPCKLVWVSCGTPSTVGRFHISCSAFPGDEETRANT